MSEELLARVIASFGLQHHGVTYEDFHASLDGFKRRMQEKSVGLHGDITADQARQRLTQKALDEHQISDGLRVSVIKANETRRGGGIGDGRQAQSDKCRFKVGDFAVVCIRVPDDGNLLVLNDEIGIELTALLPTAAAPRAYVMRGELVLPNSGQMNAFPVGAPTATTGHRALYRIHVIWTAMPTSMHSLLADQAGEQPGHLTYFELANLISDLEAAETKTWRAASCDYVVEL